MLWGLAIRSCEAGEPYLCIQFEVLQAGRAQAVCVVPSMCVKLIYVRREFGLYYRVLELVLHFSNNRIVAETYLKNKLRPGDVFLVLAFFDHCERPPAVLSANVAHWVRISCK